MNMQSGSVQSVCNAFDDDRSSCRYGELEETTEFRAGEKRTWNVCRRPIQWPHSWTTVLPRL